MNKLATKSDMRSATNETPIWLVPLKILAWPFLFAWRVLYKNWLSYLFGSVLRDDNRIYSIKFIWYGECVYLHPMVWGSLVLYFVAESDVFTQGWPLLVWFIMLAVCFLTVMYNFDVFKTGILLVCLVAVFGLAYISTMEWALNPLRGLADHLRNLDATVSPGFYVASCYVFTLLICGELAWAWLFNRVELDESYIYEHRFLRGTSREPIFARGLKRETKDLLELLILGAGDIQHRTKNGFKRYSNVPGASLGLGKAIDSMLDYRRNDQIALERRGREEEDQALITDAMPDAFEDTDDIHDDDAPGA
ncbi:MAG: hypothetical protein ACYC6N_12275 [Pirellulaceae bacterium]